MEWFCFSVFLFCLPLWWYLISVKLIGTGRRRRG